MLRSVVLFNKKVHESEIQVQGNQRFFFLAASQVVFAALQKEEKSRKPLGPGYNRNNFSGNITYFDTTVDQHFLSKYFSCKV